MSKGFSSQVTRTYATRAYFIKEQDREDFARKNPGLCSKHPIAVNVEKTDENGDAPVYHQVTGGCAGGKPLKGSEDFYKDPETRVNDLKNDPHPYSNDKHE